MASLAVANRPDAMTFVLVDYKGGSAFKDCVRLPHTVGMVTDLDTHLVERALVSLRRRAAAAASTCSPRPGAKDLEDYLDLRSAATRRWRPMPAAADRHRRVRLAWSRELPDFVTGLVNIAQRGRSLGIHLILATQRPGGVVSAEIRANTNLRIALRVTDDSESHDVIDAPDAAGILAEPRPAAPTCGCGATSLMPFQTGRVGGRSPEAETGDRPARGAGLAGAVEPGGSPGPGAAADPGRADRRGGHRPVRGGGRHHQPQRHPRRPGAAPALAGPLPRRWWRDGCPPSHGPDRPGPAVGRLGGAGPAALPEQVPKTFGSAATATSRRRRPRSGRSHAAHASPARWPASVADLHLFGLDCGNGALLPITRFPHCGAVVQRRTPNAPAVC